MKPVTRLSVACWRLCGGATIIPDYEAEEAGHAITEDPWVVGSAWEKRGKYRDMNHVFDARIMGYMAGAEAEVILLGTTQGGDDDDRYQIELMAEQIDYYPNDYPTAWPRREARLRSMTRMLVRRHRHSIERIADALIAQKTLTSEQIDTITEQHP